jgi:hypothetical protein
VSYRRRGAVYLVHFDRPYQHAEHYLGMAYPCDPARADTVVLTEVEAAACTRLTGRRLTPEQAAGVAVRIAQHRTGRGARLMEVVATAGIEFTVVRVWAGATEGIEKRLKDRNNRRDLCPACHPGTTAGTTVTPKRFRRPRARRPTALVA